MERTFMEGIKWKLKHKAMENRNLDTNPVSKKFQVQFKVVVPPP